jgi:hypothetical protein
MSAAATATYARCGRQDLSDEERRPRWLSAEVRVESFRVRIAFNVLKAGVRDSEAQICLDCRREVARLALELLRASALRDEDHVDDGVIP